jgi:hypothetical protein
MTDTPTESSAVPLLADVERAAAAAARLGGECPHTNVRPWLTDPTRQAGGRGWLQCVDCPRRFACDEEWHEAMYKVIGEWR